MAVMKALQGLSPEECARVLESAAALFKVPAPLPRTTPPEAALDSDEVGQGVERRLSLIEFMNQKGPATNAQRVVVFAYYREHVEKKGDTFARADLRSYFSAAKLAKPANYDRDFSSAAREGWIHEDGESSYLTATGEAAVKAGFGGKGKPRGRAVAKKTARKPKKAGHG